MAYNDGRFPEMITRLPQADVPVSGVQGFISQGPGHQVLFIELQTGTIIPPHAHGDQWGVVVHGEMEGTVGREPKGENGFGYDPLFTPAGFDRTSAEISAAEKNAISHRGKAFRELAQQI